MNDTPKLNPYAVGSTGEQPSVPIRFRGTLTRDDWMISKYDAPPAKGWKRFRVGATSIVFLAACLYLAGVMAGRPDSESSFMWTIIGVGLLPSWLRFALAVTPGRRARNRRLNAAARQSLEKRGWLNNQWFVEYDDRSVIRGSWSMVSNAMVFPTHLLLPQVADNNRRIILPWRFFGSVEDVRQTIDILHAKVGVLVNHPPKEKDFVSTVTNESLSDVDVESPVAWDSVHWPFPSTAEDEASFTVDLTRGRSPLTTALLVALKIALILVWIFLPVFAGLIIWLATQYQQFGGWDFVFYQPAFALVGLLPAGGLIAFAIYRSFVGAQAALKFQAAPLQLRLRSEGLHASKDDVDSWIQWTAIRQVITEPNHAGWISAETDEKLRFPKSCFASTEDFERLKTALLHYGPTETS